jgi:hypothetical protein
MVLRGSWDTALLPNLNENNCAITSPASRTYNCLAWAAGNAAFWWWPDPAHMYFWPPNVPRELTVDAFVRAYATLGFATCADGNMENGFEKIALYARRMPWGDIEPTHAARQLPNGKWTSKLGPLEDVDHSTVSDLDGPAYGSAVQFLKRPIRTRAAVSA